MGQRSEALTLRLLAAEAELASERAERRALEAPAVHASATLGSTDSLVQVGGGDADTGGLRDGGSALTLITAPPVAHDDGALATLSDSALVERGAPSADPDGQDMMSEEGASPHTTCTTCNGRGHDHSVCPSGLSKQTMSLTLVSSPSRQHPRSNEGSSSAGDRTDEDFQDVTLPKKTLKKKKKKKSGGAGSS